MDPLRVACLHTDPTFPLIYERAKREENTGTLSLEHHLRADLLAEVDPRYRGRPYAHAPIAKVLVELRRTADIVLVTSTALAMSLGENWFTSRSGIFDVDAVLTRQILTVRGKVAILCATPAAAMAVQYRFAARDVSPDLVVDVRLSQDAYAALKHDDHRAAMTHIIADADMAYRRGADVVAIPESALADAALLSGVRTALTAPGSAMLAALVVRHRGNVYSLRDRDV